MEGSDLSETSQVRRSNIAQNILPFDSIHGVATHYRLYARLGVLTPVGAGDLLFYKPVQTRGPPNHLYKGCLGSFHGGNAAEAWCCPPTLI